MAENLTLQPKLSDAMGSVVMKNHIKVLLALLGVTALTLSSCQTVEGVGRDISAGGQALSNAATR